MQMDRPGVSHRELAKRIGTPGQTARLCTAGRSCPEKRRIPSIEQALSFKLDFSEGSKEQGPTVSSAMEAADIELFLKLRRLPQGRFDSWVKDFSRRANFLLRMHQCCV